MSSSNRPNIIFILGDAVRAQNVGCYGYHKNTTPHIDSVAREGILFENAFSCTNATDPSLTSIFSGLHPRTHGILNHGEQVTDQEVRAFQSRKITLLPEILQKHGYRTFGLDWLGRWHRRGYDYYQGIKVDRAARKKRVSKIKEVAKGIAEKAGLLDLAMKAYSSPLLKRVFAKLELYSNDPKLTKRATELIRSTEEPFFMFIHYWGTHFPYISPKRYTEQFYEKGKTGKSFEAIKNPRIKNYYQQWTKNQKNFGEIIANYDGSIRNVDDQIGMILNAIKQSHKKDNTIIIITADHGESLTEHNILLNHHGLYDQSIKVPLIVNAPGVRHQRVKALAQHLDLMPTLLNILGIKEKINFQGHDLMPVIKGKQEEVRDYVYTEETLMEKKQSLRSHKHKLIMARNEKEAKCTRCGVVHGGIKEFYELEQDPKELNNIYNSENDQRKRFTKKLAEFKAELNQPVEEKELLNRAITSLKQQGGI